MRLPNSVAFDGYGGISISFQPYFLALTVHRRVEHGTVGAVVHDGGGDHVGLLVEAESASHLKVLSPRSAPETKKSNAYFHPPLSALTREEGLERVAALEVRDAAALGGQGGRRCRRSATIGPMMATALVLGDQRVDVLRRHVGVALVVERTILTWRCLPSTVTPPLAL